MIEVFEARGKFSDGFEQGKLVHPDFESETAPVWKLLVRGGIRGAGAGEVSTGRYVTPNPTRRTWINNDHPSKIQKQRSEL